VDHKRVAAALAIQGHHIGLQSRAKLRRVMPNSHIICSYPDVLRLSEADPSVLKMRFAQDGLTIPALNIGLSVRTRLDAMLDVRHLFSSLVDADYLDTEAHFEGDTGGKRNRSVAPGLQAELALKILEAHIAKLKAGSNTHPMQGVRDALLKACTERAVDSPGLFTLTAPTGSGKTLAMLAYALKHAATHGLRRVIMVIPYLTIIEQTARIYRDIFEPHFGDNYVLEHHSLAGLGTEVARSDAEGSLRQRGMSDAQRRRHQQTENWDAPLIVTTSVQMLESLFSNRPSSCRKLHRLANCVILFDEVQTLPTSLAVPTLAALSHLVSGWKSTVVFATATQPAFDAPVIHEQVRQQCTAGWKPSILVSTVLTVPRRIRWEWREHQAMSVDTLAQSIAESGTGQTLAILNTKKMARAVFETLREGGSESVRHLSTNLCPLHRTYVLGEVRNNLKTNLPVHLIATQCVEAGVDVDFPEVWRAFAPLDALIQAAGRCNRNGLRAKGGRMVVFMPEDNHYPDRSYEQAAQAAQTLLQLQPQARENPEAPEIIRAYYELLYGLRNIKLGSEMTRAIGDLDFAEIAKQYRLIRQDAINILVPYKGAAEDYEQLLKVANDRGIHGGWMRQARGLTVSLFRPEQNDVAWDSLIPLQERHRGQVNISEDWFTVSRPEHYHPELGLDLPKSLNLYIA
jgi:CRISPR-associated helicase Cas3